MTTHDMPTHCLICQRPDAQQVQIDSMKIACLCQGCIDAVVRYERTFVKEFLAGKHCIFGEKPPRKFSENEP